ncbi:hypothetical protein FRC18_002562 [Serendipita sp. 400]|nr:hypothetical protein FRC18_002562 [Serendipita sp. 400]
MSQAEIRQRNPFKFATDIPELDQDAPDRVLDEQEQEEIINQLDIENEKLQNMYTLLGTVVLALSAVAQVLSILGLLGTGGLATKAFCLLHLVLHAHGLFVLRQQTFIVFGNNDIKIPSFMPTQLLIGLYPLLSALTSTRIDWMFAGAPIVATLVTWASLSAIEEGRKGISDLQQLKYNAKGA